jgi:hypothetical protein
MNEQWRFSLPATMYFSRSPGTTPLRKRLQLLLQTSSFRGLPPKFYCLSNRSEGLSRRTRQLSLLGFTSLFDAVPGPSLTAANLALSKGLRHPAIGMCLSHGYLDRHATLLCLTSLFRASGPSLTAGDLPLSKGRGIPPQASIHLMIGSTNTPH